MSMQLKGLAIKAATNTRRMVLSALGIATSGVRVILRVQGKVLLVRHHLDDQWYLPGGGIRSGEAAWDAGVRELWEECGIRVGVSDLRLVGVYHSKLEGRSDHIFVFEAAIPGEMPEPEKGWEIDRLGLFDGDAPATAMSPATRRRLADSQAGACRFGQW